MNYTVEMRLVRIKSQAEIEEEIKEGIYKGDSHIYESVFKDDDRVIGSQEDFSPTNATKSEVEEMIKSIVAKIDGKLKDEVSITGKVKLLDLTDESFPVINRTFDYYMPEIRKVMVQTPQASEVATLPANTEEAEPQTQPWELVKGIDLNFDVPEPSFGVKFEEMTPVQAEVEGDNLSLLNAKLDTLQFSAAVAQAKGEPRQERRFTQSITMPVQRADELTSAVSSVPVVNSFAEIDVDYLKLIAKSDKRLSEDSMFNDLAINKALRPDGVRDFFANADLEPANHVQVQKKQSMPTQVKNGKNIGAVEDWLNKETPKPELPSRTVLVLQAMKNMLDLHQREKTGADEKDLDSLLIKQKFEVSMFKYKNKMYLADKKHTQAIDGEQDVFKRNEMQIEHDKFAKAELQAVVDLYKDYKRDVLGYEFEPKVAIRKAKLKAENEAQLERPTKVDYSHNPRLMHLIEKSRLREAARHELTEFKPNSIFGVEAMFDSMNLNESLTKTKTIRMKDDLLGELKLAHDPDYKGMYSKIMASVKWTNEPHLEMELPRDFFNNTKHYDYIPNMDLHGMRKHTTGEVISHYKNMDHRDNIVSEKLRNTIDSAFGEMYRSHEHELKTASYEDRDKVIAKHAFEKEYFNFQESYFKAESLSPDEQPTYSGHLSRLTKLYDIFMELNTGLSIKPTQTVEQKMVEISARKDEPEQDNSKSRAKSDTENLIRSLREKVKPQTTAEPEVDEREKVKRNITSLRLKL